FAELDELGPPDDLVHLHLVVIAGRHEAADARAAELLGRHAHPALDALEHHLLKTRRAFACIPVELVQTVDAHAQRVVALTPDVGLDLGDLVGADSLVLAAERDRVVTVLRDDRHDRLAGHVSAADEDIGVVELRGVEELLPADFRAVQVGGQEYFWHLPLHEHFSDFALEPDDVPAHDLLGVVAVPGEHRLEQLDVLVHRLAEPQLSCLGAALEGYLKLSLRVWYLMLDRLLMGREAVGDDGRLL